MKPSEITLESLPSLCEVAKCTGLSQTTIGKIYRGHFNRLDNHTIEALCKFFGLKSINQLIDIEWEPHDIEGGIA